MKKLKKLLALSCALSMIAVPSNALAATSSNETVKSSEEAVMPIENYHTWDGRLLFDNVILNATLGSDNVYLGQVNTGDWFCVHNWKTNNQGRWIYVYMLSGQNAGRYGWIFRDYTNY